MLNIARRELPALLAKLFALVMLRQPTPAAPAITLPQFLALSTRLTGRAGLDPKVGRVYLTALLAVPRNREPLAQRAPDPELEREIILAWYTGVYSANGQIRLATHSGALIWKALGTPAPGTCAGEMGFWSRPPADPR
jgi:hypothetical protein